ncbi:magnesium-translocating P-type ATPase [Ralstonia insidiosa]|nr:magnesium-translocating P-type ATPase [Ralstonia insidiosa]KMW48589.1 magnesium ABC transporter ATPase [Ralstonia sp. MD27]MBX3772698.1 magnesium-translocating P-type ATPase [Ralstonia pickettii]NOZ17614.1 magnesium-translocating P-type ATPase [Betaproteobacteria bacterium]MBA9856524.1 magnesium-translocating P-type ATPase [Ralstonia insidiosa]MBA9869123.1 magnesium-translocating P-type ATPase [Ralstonia insidiosa]
MRGRPSWRAIPRVMQPRSTRTSPSAWAAMAPQDVLDSLETQPQGLTQQEAAARLRAYGLNRVANGHHASVLAELANRSLNPLNVLLISLAGISAALGDIRAAVLIAVMVVLSVTLGFLQEHRSNRAAEALRRMVHTTAAAHRTGDDGTPRNEEIPIEQLVPGDIVQLAAGDMVPADLRLLSAKDLFVNQSALTGEAMPQERHAEQYGGMVDADFDLPNLCFMGSAIVSGFGTGVVLATGQQTAFGHVADLIAAQRVQTSFDRGITRFTWLMLTLILVMAPTVFLINGLTKGNWFEALLFAVAVAVGLTPEMLPMIVTVNLAKGAIAMSRKKVIVKRLNAIQNFGAMDVLCTDKTGTLTQDRIILKHHLDLRGEESDQVLEYAFLNSFYQSGLKNLLDISVLKHVELEQRLDVHARFRKIDELPFDFERRRMSVVLERSDGSHVLICKGAVEEVLGVSSSYASGDELGPLESGHLEHAKRMAEDLNSDGFRAVAVAYKELPQQQSQYAVADESDLILLGFIAFLDPPRDTAAEALSELKTSGVAVKILTGDNAIVARKICREVGLDVDPVVLGTELSTMSPDQMAETAERASVFAKVSPAQKAAIVEALHRKGHVVGFMGDGINDGPALKAADVGISVDSAVDIAKESADIILLEKSLAVLGEGVTEGRKVFGNIVKYIKMGASSNFGNVFSVLGASLFLPFLPMAPVQVLLNNLLYDFSQTAIPTDNVDEDYLVRPRRWEIGHILKFMLYIGPVSSVFDFATYALMLWVFHAWGNPPLFQSGWFVESLLTQTLIIHIIRTAKVPFVESRASTALIATSVAIACVGVAMPLTPLGTLFGFVPLPVGYWPCLAAIVVVYAVLTHLMKTWYVRRYGLD